MVGNPECWTMFSAGCENNDGEILLLLNPNEAGRLMVVPEVLHPGPAMAVKSPASI